MPATFHVIFVNDFRCESRHSLTGDSKWMNDFGRDFDLGHLEDRAPDLCLIPLDPKFRVFPKLSKITQKTRFWPLIQTKLCSKSLNSKMYSCSLFHTTKMKCKVFHIQVRSEYIFRFSRKVHTFSRQFFGEPIFIELFTRISKYIHFEHGRKRLTFDSNYMNMKICWETSNQIENEPILNTEG